MPRKPKFTRIPKIPDLVEAGISPEAIATYCCLADYANNKTGLCWPKMQSLASTLNRSIRTIQRHLHQLRELGLIEFVERRRHKGRFSSYTYKVLHIATTGHGKPVAKGRSIYRRTKPSKNTPKPPSNKVTDGYRWLFGEEAPENEHREYQIVAEKRREEAARRRTDGFEWLFK